MAVENLKLRRENAEEVKEAKLVLEK